VIPFFERVPLLSSKRLDFEKFASVVREMAAGRHLTPGGFDKLLGVSLSMNGGGRFRQMRWAEVVSSELQARAAKTRPFALAHPASVSDSKSLG
jgi:hypothetical protein